MYCGFVIDKGLFENGGLVPIVFDVRKMDPKKHQKLAEAYIEDIPADFEKFGKELDVSHNSTEIRQGAR